MPLLSEKFGHNGIEYSIKLLSDYKWRWAFYPKLGTGMRQDGEVTGTKEDAIAACKKAIDTFVASRQS